MAPSTRSTVVSQGEDRQPFQRRRRDRVLRRDRGDARGSSPGHPHNHGHGRHLSRLVLIIHSAGPDCAEALTQAVHHTNSSEQHSTPLGGNCFVEESGTPLLNPDQPLNPISKCAGPCCAPRTPSRPFRRGRPGRWSRQPARHLQQFHVRQGGSAVADALLHIPTREQRPRLWHPAHRPRPTSDRRPHHTYDPWLSRMSAR